MLRGRLGRPRFLMQRQTPTVFCAAVFATLLGACSNSADEDSDGLGAHATGAASSTGGSTSGTGGAASGTGASAAGGAASGGTGAQNGSGGAAVELPEPCAAGSVIEALTPDAGVARYGTVFGPTLYEDDVVSSYDPQKISVKVTSGGAPVSGCEVAFDTEPGHGWVFADAAVTDADGVVSAYWTAGDVASESARAFITLEGGGTSEATITGSASPSPETRSNSIHLNYDVPGEFAEFKLQVTPLTAPESTYYSTLNWTGAYGGIQFDGATTKVIFSVWDTGGKSSLITDDGVCNETVQFGGEGTGTSCRLIFPPSAHGAIAGLPSDYELVAGDTYETHLVVTHPSDCGGTCTDYTFTFTDVTRGLGPISLGTQRYMENVSPYWASSFVEDWWSVAGDDCISAGARTAYFHDVQARIGGSWKPIEHATFSPNFKPDNHEICANYEGSVVDGKFLMSSGGDEHVGPPLFGDDVDLTLP